MRKLSLSVVALLLVTSDPAVAAPCSGDLQASVGAVTRIQSGPFRIVVRTVARKGPLAVQEMMRLNTGFQDGVQTYYTVTYGFLGVGGLKDFLPGDAAPSTSIADRPVFNEVLLNEIAEALEQKDPDFKARMDEIWRQPTPGMSVSYVEDGQKTTVTVAAMERVEDFPDADGATDAVVLEVESEMMGRSRLWFSTEHCQVVRDQFQGKGDPQQAWDRDIPLVRKIERRHGKPATPEAVIRELNAAMNTLDAEAIVALIHPDWLAELKAVFQAAHQQGKGKMLRLLLGREVTSDMLALLSGADLYRAQLSNAMKRQTLAAVFMSLSLDVTGVEGLAENRAEVAVRTTLPKDGEGRAVSKTESLNVVRTEAAGWLLRPEAGRRDGFFAGFGVRLP